MAPLPQPPARRSVSDGAYDYVRERLWLARGLGPYLLEVLDPARFSCWTVADPAVTDERLGRFGAGGFALAGSVGEVVADVVAGTLEHCDGGVFVAPDPMGRPGDPFLDRVSGEYFTVGDGIYRVARAPDPTVLINTWGYAGSAVGQLGIVTRHPIGASPTEEDLRDSVAAAVLIVVEAYDGNGALFLTPTETSG